MQLATHKQEEEEGGRRKRQSHVFARTVDHVALRLRVCQVQLDRVGLRDGMRRSHLLSTVHSQHVGDQQGFSGREPGLRSGWSIAA